MASGSLSDSTACSPSRTPEDLPVDIDAKPTPPCISLLLQRGKILAPTTDAVGAAAAALDRNGTVVKHAVSGTLVRTPAIAGHSILLRAMAPLFYCRMAPGTERPGKAPGTHTPHSVQADMLNVGCYTKAPGHNNANYSPVKTIFPQLYLTK